MTHPLMLSPNYVKLEESTEKEEVATQKKEVVTQRREYRKRSSSLAAAAIALGKNHSYFYSMESKNPAKLRFVLLHGRGDALLGMRHYEKYWDAAHKEAKNTIQIMTKTRSKSAYARHIGLTLSVLTSCMREQKEKRREWGKLLTLIKIIRGIKTFDMQTNEAQKTQPKEKK